MDPAARARIPIVGLGIFALLAAMWGGLLRLGWDLPPLAPVVTGIHGPLMVAGFLGTLISMERAVALRARWAYVAPVASALGALVLLSGAAPVVAALLITLGSLGMLAIFGVIVRRQPALFTYTMALGALLWFVGNLVWLSGAFVSRVVLWWAGFLILTIVGERLELARLRRLSRLSETLYGAAVALFMLGIIIDLGEGLFFAEAGSAIGSRLAGAGMLALAAWLFQYDIARRTVLQSGLTRFIALCLLSGYVWLALGGALRLINGDAVMSGPYYDAMLHTIFLGFVMSMIFGHAPIIFPAVLGRAILYHSSFYAHWVVLHLSLILRIVGDLSGVVPLRQWGGMFNVIAVLIFLFATARSIAEGARGPKPAPALARH